MSYIQRENTNRVNIIKQRFEQSPEKKLEDNLKSTHDDKKEQLRRTLSASPIKTKKNFKLNVSRQLSNPSRNIKRTPAFRGDKLARTKNLNSPTKEKLVSIVDKNVKLFEEKPEYGKIGNVKKKVRNAATNKYESVDASIDTVDCNETQEISDIKWTSDIRQETFSEHKQIPKDINNLNEMWSEDDMNKKMLQIFSKKSTPCKDSVRTTVISRHTNISPNYCTQYELDNVCRKSEMCESRTKQNSIDDKKQNYLQPNKFLKNGVEYTRVIKPKIKSVLADTTSNHSYSQTHCRNENNILDIREDLSRRKFDKLGALNNESSKKIKLCRVESSEINTPENVMQNMLQIKQTHESLNIETHSVKETEKEPLSITNSEERFGVKLTDTLKAALKAPLPKGPPPKKPPRTFAHSPTDLDHSLFHNHNETNKPQEKLENHTIVSSFGNTSTELSSDTKHVINSFLHSIKINNGDESITDSSLKDADWYTTSFLHGKRNSSQQLQKQLATENKNIDNENLVPFITDISKTSPTCINKSKFDDMILETHLLENRTLVVERRKLNDDQQPKADKSSEVRSNDPSSSPATICNDTMSLDQNKIISQSSRKFQSSTPMSENSTKLRASRDSKKMLEKLESVLIQHQKALGPKVIVPRKEKLTDVRSKLQTDFECDIESDIFCGKNDSEKRIFTSDREVQNTRVLGSLPKIPDSPCRRNFTFDCLPSLNCASSTVYEQIKNPDFKTYLADGKSTSLERSGNFYAKPGGLQKNSTFYLHSSNDEIYDTLLASPASKRLSTELTTFTDVTKHQPTTFKHEEHVYAEPFTFDNNSGIDITGYGKLLHKNHDFLLRNEQAGALRTNNTKETELHYMIEQLLDQAFGEPVMAGAETPTDSNTSSDTDSVASTLSLTDELLTFNEKLKLFKERENIPRSAKDDLHRSLTEKRKHYVRNVSSKYSEKREGSVTDRRDKLFEVCLLVELNLSTRKPYIKDKYPIYVNTPAWIENFCFPDASDWPPSDSDQNQAYSLVLTDEKGNRRYGYCYRVKPEGGPILPLAYCLITNTRASGFYYKILHELDIRHGFPDRQRRSFIEELYNSPMPLPGHGITIKWDEAEVLVVPSLRENGLSNNNNDVETKFTNSNGESYNTAPPAVDISSVLLRAERSEIDKIIDAFTDLDVKETFITRPGDHRLEERDMSQLFDALSVKVLIVLFGSLLLERKVVLTCNKLSKLSSCVEALQSLLYPFTWPHTFIPVLPDIPGLPEILQAPLPFVIGILKSKNGDGIEITTFENGIVVDLDTSKITFAVGDESSILPSRFQKGLRSALHVVSSTTKTGEGIKNFLVSEAFLRVFVESCSHFGSHIVAQENGKLVFMKESFVNAVSSKCFKYFLEWFVETTMFNQFVQDNISRMEGILPKEKDDMKLFHQRVAEYLKAADKNAQTKKSHTKKKTLGDRLKDLTNFSS
ncbi:uncharacterized protein LOC107263636 isoform X2 [Cephus cinctus]|uniref:Uncharacterized protein LOC107263636 isoform X2 n=1 Tax=Cephus cinctus TaxID=211228 RepID=A0AAJ7BHY9_CEPCN|nr:uncharacterized protein LOC107263636 isoform X2 [Cephus cinctus]